MGPILSWVTNQCWEAWLLTRKIVVLEFFLYPDLLELFLFSRIQEATNQPMDYLLYLLTYEKNFLAQNFWKWWEKGIIVDRCLVESRAAWYGAGPCCSLWSPPLFLENEIEWGRSDPSNLLLPVRFQQAKHSLDTDCFWFSSIFTALNRYYTALSVYYSQVLINGWLFLVSEPILSFCLFVFMCILTGNWVGTVREFGLMSSLFRSQFMTIYSMSYLIIAFDCKEMPLVELADLKGFGR